MRHTCFAQVSNINDEGRLVTLEGYFTARGDTVDDLDVVVEGAG